MKLLKELFSFDEYDDDEFSPEADDDEFDFNFDFENPDMDQELDFNDDGDRRSALDYDDDNDDYGAEEDYPEDMRDMPTDEYDEDGNGGLTDEIPDEQEELADIKGEIESLYARLGKLAAAGDLNLLDGEPSDDVEVDDNPEFSSFQNLDLGYDDEEMEPDFDDFDDFDEFDEDEVESEFDDIPDEDEVDASRPSRSRNRRF